MSKTKATSPTTKFPTIVSECSFDSSENLTFHLKPTRLQQVSGDPDDARYIVTRAQARKLLKSAAAAPTPENIGPDDCNAVYVDVPYDYQSYGGSKRRIKGITHYDITRHKGGKVSIGCQTFSAKAVKMIREWAGATGEGKK